MFLTSAILKNRRKIFVSNLLIFFIILMMYLIPQFRILPFYNYLQILFYGIWFITALMLYPKYFQENRLQIILIGIYSIYMLTSSLLTDNFSMFKRFFGLVFFLLLYIVYHFYKTNMAYMIRRFAIVALGLIPIFNCISIVFVLRFPYIIRNVFDEGSKYYQYLKFGVVGYDYIFSLIIIVPILVYSIFGEYNFSERIRHLLWLNLISSLLLILLSGYSLSILILFAGVLMISLVRKFNSRHLKQYLYLGILLLLLLPLLIWILSFALSDTAYASKIEILMNFMKTGKISGAILDARILAYGKSLSTIIRYPLSGLIFHEKIVLVSVADGLGRVGQHSSLLDSGAVFGLPMLALLMYNIFYPIRVMYIKAQSNQNLASLILGIGGMLFLVLLLNNDIPVLSFAVYFGLGNSILLSKKAGYTPLKREKSRNIS